MEKDKRIKLTAIQISDIDTITWDKEAIDNTYEIAINYHANRTNELKKRKKQWWDEIIKAHDLDPAKQWTINHDRKGEIDSPFVEIVEVKQTD